MSERLSQSREGWDDFDPAHGWDLRPESAAEAPPVLPERPGWPVRPDPTSGMSGGLDALRPAERADAGTVRAHPELFAEAAALRLELPSRSAAQIASILFHRHGVRVAERTVRAQLRRAGLHREALAAEPKVFGRYEADHANDRWITDVLVGPYVPYPRIDASVRARLFLIVDDHSRLAYSEILPDETGKTCAAFLERAAAYFATKGIIRIERVMTDNAFCYRHSHAYQQLLTQLGARHIRTPPFTPRWNGKVERFIRTLDDEWAHGRVWNPSTKRDRALASWLRYYNRRRPHTSLADRPPLSRVHQDRGQNI